MVRPFRVLVPVIAVLALLFLVACGDDEDEEPSGLGAAGTAAAVDTKNPFRIGVVADLTGPFSAFSAPNVVAEKAAVAVINKNGGILGREVVLDVKDSQSDPKKAAELGAEMVLSKKYPVMHVSSVGAITGLAPMITQNKVLTFSVSGDLSLQDPKKFPFNFELVSKTEEQALSSACYFSTLGHKSVGILYFDLGTYSRTSSEVWQQNFPRLGVKVTGTEAAPAGTLDVTAQLTKLKASNPEALVVSATGTDYANLITGMKNLKYDIPVLGDSATSVTDFVAVLKSLDEIPKNSTMAAWEITVRKPSGLLEGQKRAIDALKAAGTKVERPLFNYTFGWDIIHFAKYAAETAKSDDPTKMVQALETLGAKSLEEQLKLNILTLRWPFSSDFHGLKGVKFAAAKPGKLTDGLWEYAGKDFKDPC